VAVVNAMQHVLIEEGLLDHDFIERHALGFEEMKAELEGCTPEWASEISGVDPELIRKAARMYGAAEAAQFLWGLGVTEAGHGSNTVFGMINMAVMTGNLGRPGAGTSPIRGRTTCRAPRTWGRSPMSSATTAG
jgi:anaerobic selenocysteine-containing dehydrogenase